MKLLLLTILLLNISLQETVMQISNDNKKQRKLSETDMMSERVLENEKMISIEKIREQIIDLHKNVKLCIDNEFDKDPSEILAFQDILKLCVGENYSIILRFYDDINFEIKEITKEKIKNSLKDNYCDDILFQCIAFFKTIDLFIVKDYDLLKSIELNRKEIERKVETEHLQYLIDLTRKQLQDYDYVRQDLLETRKLLTEYFKQKDEEYKQKYSIDQN